MTNIHRQSAKDIDPEDNSVEETIVPTEPKAPTWFTRDISQESGDDLAEQYRASRSESRLSIETPGPDAYADYKRKLDEKFSQAQRLYDVPPAQAPIARRPTLPMSDIHSRRRHYEKEQPAQPVQNLSKRSAVPWFKIIGYGMIAIVVGGGAGFGFANKERLASLLSSTSSNAQIVVASLLPQDVKSPPSANVTVIQKKTVQTASLDVNDVRGTLNSMIPLMLTAQAADGADPVALKIMGLPSDAYLTAGKEVTKGNWLVQPSDIAGVKLVVPQLDSNQFNMEIAAIEEKTGELAAPIKAMNVKVDQPVVADTKPVELNQELAAVDLAATIAPANAPAVSSGSNQVAASPIPDAIPEASALISKGDGLLNGGDIISARQLYLQANSLGDAKGAYGVGRTYDPQVFAALNENGLKPDPAKAAQWYQTAIEGGVVVAKTALSSLQASQ